MASGIASWFYETYVPAQFILDDGLSEFISASIVEEKMVREPLFLLYVSPHSIEAIATSLRNQGFVETHRVRGEVYSFVKRLEDPWELYIRIFSNGFIESEVRVGDIFAEKLGSINLFVVYEPYNFYSQIYNKLHILYKPRRKWVIKVLNNFRIQMRPPKLLAPWKTITISYEALSVTEPLIYLLSRLERDDVGVAIPI